MEALVEGHKSKQLLINPLSVSLIRRKGEEEKSLSSHLSERLLRKKQNLLSKSC